MLEHSSALAYVVVLGLSLGLAELQACKSRHLLCPLLPTRSLKLWAGSYSCPS